MPIQSLCNKPKDCTGLFALSLHYIRPLCIFLRPGHVAFTNCVEAAQLLKLSIFFKRGEPGSVREAGGEATEAMAASVRVNRKDD